jgi:hypothetical protein
MGIGHLLLARHLDFSELEVTRGADYLSIVVPALFFKAKFENLIVKVFLAINIYVGIRQHQIIWIHPT